MNFDEWNSVEFWTLNDGDIITNQLILLPSLAASIDKPYIIKQICTSQCIPKTLRRVVFFFPQRGRLILAPVWETNRSISADLKQRALWQWVLSSCMKFKKFSMSPTVVSTVGLATWMNMGMWYCCPSKAAPTLWPQHKLIVSSRWFKTHPICIWMNFKTGWPLNMT